MTNWFKHKLTRDTVWLTSSELASRLLLFIVVTWLTRYLGSTTYGELAYGFAVANIVVIVADLGLSTFATRELAKHPDELKQRLTKLLGVKAQLFLLGLFAMTVTSVLLNHIAFSVALLGGVAILLMNTRMFIEACYRSQRKMYLEAISKMFNSLVLSGTLIYLIQQHSNLQTVVIGYVSASAVATILSIVLLYIFVSPFQIQFSAIASKTVLAVAWPFSLSLLFNYLFNYEDSVILGHFFGQIKEVGWYTAAYKPIFFMTAIAGMVINAFFPIIVKQFHQDKALVPGTVRKLFFVNMALALPMAIVGTIIAKPLIGFLYPAEFAPATLAFQILLWSTVGIYFWATFGNSLQAIGHEKIYLRNFAIGAVLNTVLNFLLIPWWSLYGAATATLLTQLFLCIVMYRDYKKVWKKV